MPTNEAEHYGGNPKSKNEVERVRAGVGLKDLAYRGAVETSKLGSAGNPNQGRLYPHAEMEKSVLSDAQMSTKTGVKRSSVAPVVPIAPAARTTKKLIKQHGGDVKAANAVQTRAGRATLNKKAVERFGPNPMQTAIAKTRAKRDAAPAGSGEIWYEDASKQTYDAGKTEERSGPEMANAVSAASARMPWKDVATPSQDLPQRQLPGLEGHQRMNLNIETARQGVRAGQAHGPRLSDEQVRGAKQHLAGRPVMDTQIRGAAKTIGQPSEKGVQLKGDAQKQPNFAENLNASHPSSWARLQANKPVTIDSIQSRAMGDSGKGPHGTLSWTGTKPAGYNFAASAVTNATRDHNAEALRAGRPLIAPRSMQAGSWIAEKAGSPTEPISTAPALGRATRASRGKGG